MFAHDCRWVIKRDIMEDKIYYEHSETGETNWAQPAPGKDFVYDRAGIRNQIQRVQAIEQLEDAAV